MTEPNIQPLSLVNELSEHLSKTGTCQQVYATAEFQPFSSAFKPDLLFRPRQGPRSGQSVFMEFTQTFRGYQDRTAVPMFEERQNFVCSYLEERVNYYIVFTDLRIDAFSVAALQQKSIYVCEYSAALDSVVRSLKSLSMI